MAARITITPEELRVSSNNFKSKSDEITEILSYLRSEVDRLEATWDGASQDQFFIMYEQMEQNLKTFPEILNGISTQLSTVAQTLEETDQSIADSLKG